MILTTAALTLGLTLALFGVAVFYLEATAAYRDRETLRAARAYATAGRWLAALGVALRLIHGGQYGTPMVAALLLATVAAVATLITKANLTGNTIATTGATP